MCGIAGFSLTPYSRLDRTLAAQALLAAVAERGGDAVGYAYPDPSATGRAVVVKQRTPASKLLEQVSVPDGATELIVHVRAFTKGHPSIAANNHPVRHGPVVGVHNGRILNDDELLLPAQTGIFRLFLVLLLAVRVVERRQELDCGLRMLVLLLEMGL